MNYVSEIIRKRVRKRAGNRCEYCLSHQDYIMGRLQIDHVYPVVKGGENTEENLCLACELCNQFNLISLICNHYRSTDKCMCLYYSFCICKTPNFSLR